MPRTSLRLVSCAAIFVALLAVGVPGSNARPAAAAQPDVCGTQPGDDVGAYAFVKVWNMSCARARDVAGNAYDRFCEREDCATDPSGGYIGGKVAFNGWKCKVKLGYEFSRARCEKQNRRLVQEFGA